MTKQVRRRPWSVRVATVAGIEIRVHLSFAVLVALVALGSSGDEGPGLVGGLAWLAVLFSCVVVHELAHSVVARGRGAVVRDILLLPVGGVSEIERLPERPADELAVAAAGPLTSLGLAGAAALLAAAGGVALWPPDIVDGPFLHRLAWVNLLLGGFNLLPAFPLDGGRVLRAALARRVGLAAATSRAAAAGRALAAVMIVIGVLFDPWLVVIGVFVYMAGSAEEAATLVRAALGDLRVDDVMVPPTPDALGEAAGVPPVAPQARLVDAVEQVVAARATSTSVEDGGRVVGVLRLDDVGRLVSRRRAGRWRSAA